jgi:hypothetical protein
VGITASRGETLPITAEWGEMVELKRIKLFFVGYANQKDCGQDNLTEVVRAATQRGKRENADEQAEVAEREGAKDVFGDTPIK